MVVHKRKRSRRDSSPSSISPQRKYHSSSSRTHTYPPSERMRSRHSSSHSSSGSVEVEDLTQVLVRILIRQVPSTPVTNTLGGDLIPPFNPEDTLLSIEVWCNRIDEMRQMFGWAEHSTIYFALSKLRGLASTWYKSLPSIDCSWEEWKNRLILAFPTRRNYCELLQSMLNRRKQVDETYMNYYYDKLSLLHLCKITGKDAVSCIIGGISEAHISAAAIARNYANPESLLAFLVTSDDATKYRRLRRNLSTN